jgi:thioredoxin 1
MDNAEVHSYITLTDANFNTEVESFAGVTVVDFWAEWCTPCRAIAPLIEALSKKYADNKQVKIGKLDTDSNPNVSMTYQIMSIPTVKFYVGGKLVDELNGYMGPATGVMLQDKLAAALGKLPAAA